MSLYGDWLRHKGDVVHKWHHYFPIYERHFSPWVNQSLVFLEIGVARGGSLQMWQEYFGPYAVIVGIDIDPRVKAHEKRGIHIRIGSQTDPGFLSSVIREFGMPAIVLDDGSHINEHMFRTFSLLYQHLPNNGVYMVEDCHACYWDQYGGGLRRQDSFIEQAKAHIDLLNAYHYNKNGEVPQFTQQTWSICFYDSIVVFEKKFHSRPYAEQIS